MKHQECNNNNVPDSDTNYLSQTTESCAMKSEFTPINLLPKLILLGIETGASYSSAKNGNRWTTEVLKLVDNIFENKLATY